jgi:hypothetical protein
MNALYSAAANGHIEIVELLLVREDQALAPAAGLMVERHG